MTDLSAFVPPALNVMIVIVGWKVLFKNARKIATRSETRSLVDRSAVLLRDIEKRAKDFWCKRGEDFDPEGIRSWTMQIQHDLQLLESGLDLIERRGLSLNIGHKLFEIRRAVTFGCEIQNREPDIGRVLEIANASNKLCENLEDTFLELYEPSV